MRLTRILLIAILMYAGVAAAVPNFGIKTVVIDAGHGGKDPGAIGPGKTQEKDIALIVALKLGDYIQKNHPDIKVVYTRKTDVFLELHERANIANKNKADLFISVHINASTNAEVFGSSTYVLGLHRTEANLDVAKRENSVILLEDDRDKNYEFDPNSPEGHIIMSMKQNAFLDQSIDLASKIENQMESYGKRRSLGVKQAGFYVLYKTTMPSILAELGFISNPEEEKFLNSVKGQDLIATSLYNAFKDYKREMEGSEGEMFVQEQLKEKAETTAATSNETKTTTTKEQPTTAVQAETKSTVDTKESTTVSVAGGKKIRIPIENSNGGGKATKPLITTEKEVEPIYVRPSNLNPFDTSSMSKSISGRSENNRASTNGNGNSGTVTTEAKKSPLVPDHKPENGIVFKVQLFALRGELKDYEKINRLFTEISAEGLPNGFTRYYGGKSKTYAEAKKLLDAAKNAGYSAAFIVGFNNGNRMGADEMKTYEQ